MRYWTASQLPNFLLASPHILISIFAFSQHLRNKHGYYTFLSNPLTPHVLALAGMSIILFTSMHVQIATRVLTAFPALYWYVAGKVLDDVQGVWVERTRFWEGGVRAIVVCWSSFIFGVLTAGIEISLAGRVTMRRLM